MKIGFDIDNVVSAFDEMLLKLMLEEDKTKRNKGIINPNADYIIHGMLDWSNLIGRSLQKCAKAKK